MKVLITGATGFIGRRLVKRLLENNHEIVVLSRNAERAKAELGLPVTAFDWQATQAPPPTAAFQGVGAIVHLAGESVAGGRWSDERKRSIRDSRVLGTRNLLAGLATCPDAKPALISASAIGFYGDRGDESLTETSAVGAGFLAEVCQEWEDEVAKARSLGLRTVSLRIGVVLGADGGILEKLLPLFTAGLGGKLSNGKQWMSWIHVDDLVSMFVAAVENPSWSGVVNAVAPGPVTNAEFTLAMGQALHKPTFLQAPGAAIRMAMGEMSEVALGSQRVKAQAASTLGFTWAYASITQALAAICTPDVLAGDSVFEAHQWVPRPVADLWEFFTAAENLEKITPPWIGFRILRKSTDAMMKGTLIDYRIKIHGVPAKWRTLIEEWNPKRSFVDTQLQGPYRKWHHTHTFTAMKGGTLLGDRVVYRLPVGIAGRVLMGNFVRGDVSKIFNYRREVIARRFGDSV